MKKHSILCVLLILSLLFVGLCGCSQEQSNNDSKKVGETTEARDANSDKSSSNKIDASSSKAANKKNDKEDDKNIPLNDYESIPAEKREAMAQITGKWQAQLPEGVGSEIVKVKFDNIGGFTIATGNADSEYAHVGSYELTGNNLTLNATTGGPSNGEDSYELRMDPAVFEYTYSINPERTQLVLTPQNDNAKQLTGTGAITLSKN